MIFIQITEQLKSLSDLLRMLSDGQYNKKIAFLGSASIGGHTRHIIELLKCVTDGYNSGNIDYLNRIRNMSIESDKSIALMELSLMADQIIRSDKQMKVAIETGEDGSAGFVTTTFFREIVYNAEHAVHHLALIRVALREMELEIVGDDFGMAYSTIKYLSSQNKTQN